MSWGAAIDASEPGQGIRQQEGTMRTVYGVIVAAAALQVGLTASAWAQNYSGAYVGSYTASAAPGPHRVTLNFTQSGSAMSGKYATSTGVGGLCDGFLVGSVAQMVCHNTTPGCYGNYQGPYTFSPSGVTWTYTGYDCLGFEQGAGKAVKITAHAKHKK
jgi:hypothetical protein